MNFYHSNLLFSKDGKALEYLNQREITDATIKHFKLGFASKNRPSLSNVIRPRL